MSLFSFPRLPRKKNTFAPRLETLEDRTTPAVAVVQVGNTLTVTGDATNNLVQIVDTGTGGVGNITIFSESGMFTSDAITPITNIVVNTLAGDDGVGYQVFGNFSAQQSVQVNLGDGNDLFVGRTHGVVQPNARLRLTSFGGNGNDRLIAQMLNSISSGATVNWDAFGEAGNDISTLTLTGNLFGAASLLANVDLGTGDDGWDALIQGTILNNALAQFTAVGGTGADVVDSTFRTDHVAGSRTLVNYQGGDGIDNVRINAGGDVDVDAGAEMTFQLSGGADADIMLLQHGGRLNGIFNGFLDGGTGNDNIRATQFLNDGSNPTRGTDVWRVTGSDGNDTLRLSIKPNAFTSAVVNGRINAGAGFDTCFRSPNVSANGCEVETIV